MNNVKRMLPPLIIGIIAIVAGIFSVAYPKDASNTLAIVLGVVAIVLGVLMAVSAINVGNVLGTVLGVIVVILGVVIVSKPGTFVEWLGLIIGIWFVVAGVFGLIRNTKRFSSQFLSIIFNGLLVIGGILLIIGQWAFANALGILIGIWLIIYGVSYLLIAFSKE